MASVWSLVAGQENAVETLRSSAARPVHSYLFVGPEGCGKETAARAFAAELISGTDEVDDRACSLVMRGGHADVHEIRREGASILKDQAEEVIRLASTTPVEGKRKVIMMHEVDLMQDTAAARLLKTIEEPADGVFLLLLAHQLVPTLATIESRCLVVHFGAINDDTIAAILVAEGTSPDKARSIARAAHGSIDRARLLTSDARLLDRLKFFSDIPHHLDGSGSTVARLVDEATELITQALDPLTRSHEQEIAEWEQRSSLVGGSRRGKKEMDDRHKREVRKYRTDEIRAGLTEMSITYRNALADNPGISRPDVLIAAIERLHATSRRLSLNVNETLLLRDVVWSLPSLNAGNTLVFD